MRGRQDDNQVTYMVPLTVLGAVLGGLGVSNLLQRALQPRQQLQDHPMCGLTTGGQVGVAPLLYTDDKDRVRSKSGIRIRGFSVRIHFE